MKALILAAGRGERLRPLTDTLPKPLVDVQGAPIIDYVLANLKRAGITEVAVNLGYRGNQIKKHLGDQVKYIEEKDPIKALHGLWEWLSDPFLVCNGDTITNVNVRKMIKLHRHTYPATVFVQGDPPYNGGTYLICLPTLHLVGTPNGGTIDELLFNVTCNLYRPKDAYFYDCGTPEKLREAREAKW